MSNTVFLFLCVCVSFLQEEGCNERNTSVMAKTQIMEGRVLTIDKLGKYALEVLFRCHGSLVCDKLKKLSSCGIVQNNAHLQRGLDNFVKVHDVGVLDGLVKAYRKKWTT